ncbi:hypothetical protein Cgig2_019848 [Carnegiea gigantea]|uniref:Uncharacterized protein n=1 Tax=Carnegiea gigantea TaxID=171969 RepID=A0A9Q1Q6R4_9CARY|nr:hypothetical protein Cgig2_019848 [Carnegiea gigantea]
MKIASAIVQRILIDMGSSIDIITWDCLKKLAHPGRDIVPLVHPILDFGGQEVNPTRMIRLPVCFGNKLRSKNLDIDFLVVDVPTAYNMILGGPTVHKEGWGLHVGLSTILMTLLLRSPGLSIQGVGCLVPCALTLTGRRDKLHILGVMAFIFGPLTLIYVVEVSLKIAVLLKLLGQRHQDPAAALLVALLVGLGRLSALTAASSLAFGSASSSWRYKLFFSASQASKSTFSFCQSCLCRVTSPTNLRHSAAALPPSEHRGHCYFLLSDL